MSHHIFVLSLPGVEPVTFNGQNSSARLNIPTNSTNLTFVEFSVRTRKEGCFILGSSDGNYYLGVGLKTGKISVNSSTGQAIQGSKFFYFFSKTAVHFGLFQKNNHTGGWM